MTTKPATGKFIGVFSLAMINTAVIVNLNNLPAMVILGYSLLTYLLLAVIFFFLPTALISAELATGWPVKGGLYSWVRIAFGPIMGFTAIWLQWIANVIWYPTLLAPAVVSSLYVFDPALQSDKWSLFLIMVGIFWLITWLNLRGMRESSAISSFGVLLGNLLPGAVIVIFAIIWINHHFPVATHYVAGALTPPITNFSSMSILISILVNLVGMEMSAVHASNVDQPRKTYPRAILIAVLIILCVFIFTSLGLGVIVPADKIDLVTGVIQAISSFGNAMHVPFLLPILTALIAIGILTNASTWISGPSKGLQIAALDGDIPRFFQKLNKREMPGRLLIAQAILFTFLTLVFVFIPSVDSSYWILLALTGQLYMLMYFIMFISGLRLRYKYPNVFREYRIPGRYNLGMWVVAGCGCFGTATAFIMTYFPPAQLALNGTQHYVALLLISFSITLILPVILFCGYYWYRKRRVILDYGYEESTDLPLPEAEHLPIAVSELKSIESKLRTRVKKPK